MFYDYKGSTMLQSKMIPCMRSFVSDVEELLNMATDGDVIQIYADEEVAEELFDELIEGMDYLEICDDLCDTEQDYYLIICIGSDGTISIENAHTDDGFLKEPSDYFNYVHEEVPYKIVAELDTYEVPILTFDFDDSECNDCDLYDAKILVDNEGKIHGFNYEKTLRNGTTEYKSCYSTNELDENLLKEIFRNL